MAIWSADEYREKILEYYAIRNFTVPNLLRRIVWKKIMTLTTPWEWLTATIDSGSDMTFPR